MKKKHFIKSKQICFFIVVVLVFLLLSISLFLYKIHLSDIKKQTKSTLMGATDINPSVMYHNKIYSWKKMAGPNSKLPKGSLPKGYKYVGDIDKISGKNQKKDFQFIAVFSAKGKLYYNAKNKNQVVICITTDWLTDAYVIFKVK